MTSLKKLWFPYFLKAQPIPCIKQLQCLEYISIWLKYDPKLNTTLGNEKLRKTCLKLGKVFMQGCIYLHKNTIKHVLSFFWAFTLFDEIEKWLIVHKKLKSVKPWKIDFFYVWSPIAQNSNFRHKPENPGPSHIFLIPLKHANKITHNVHELMFIIVLLWIEKDTVVAKEFHS